MTKIQLNPAGRPFTYDVNKFPFIISNVEQAKGSMGQVADLCGIPRQTFFHWLRRGEDDRNNDKCSELAELSSKIRTEQARVVKEFVMRALDRHQNATFIMWWLGKICREDFGEDSEDIRQLKALCLTLMEIKGDSNGRKAKEVDTEIDQASGSFA